MNFEFIVYFKNIPDSELFSIIASDEDTAYNELCDLLEYEYSNYSISKVKLYAIDGEQL